MRTPIEPFLPTMAQRFLAGDNLDLLRPLSLVEGSDAKVPLPEGRSAPDRSALAAALLESNRTWGHADPEPLCRKLADPETLVVITGQQAGLLGGPLYSLTKAIAASRWAATLEQSGKPAVALFWVATEDHDHAEVACCRAASTGGESRVFSLDGPDQELRPVGDLCLGPSVIEVLASIGEDLGDRQRVALDKLAQTTRPDSRFGDSFCSALALILGQHCPLLLDAQEPELKKLERPWLRLWIERRFQLDRAVAEREQEINDCGLSIQVAPQTEWSPLFLLDDQGQRRRVGWRSEDRFVLRGSDADKVDSAANDPAGTEEGEPIERLLEILDQEPSRLSPGVLARPAIQDAALGTALFVLGPSELAYMAQASAVYPVLGLKATVLALRPQVLVVDPRRRAQLEQLAERGIGLDAVLGPESDLEALIAELAGGEPVSVAREEILDRLDRLQEPLLDIEPQLRSALAKTRSQIERGLEMLRAKTVQSVARSDEVTRARVSALRQLCLPGGSLQERVSTAGPLFCHYGSALGEALWRDLDLDPRFLQVVSPEEGAHSESRSLVTESST